MALPATDESLWFRRFHPRPEAEISLVCLPHAGGAASFWFPLSELLPPTVEALAVQDPGRQDRRHDPHIESVHEMAREVFEALEPLAAERPLALFGHSMGASVGFELARLLEAERDTVPVALFASGRPAPSRHRSRGIHRLDDAGIISELQLVSGTDARILGDAELLRLALSSIRSDYKAAETYEYRPGPRLRCDIVGLIGDSDNRVAVGRRLSRRYRFQTVVIGWINLLSSRLNEQHQRRKRTVAELRSALAENAGLHAQLITQAREAGVHDERQRMAGEIHDTLAQGLAGIIRQLEAAEDAEHDRERFRRHVVAAKDLARESLAEARRSVQALRPEQLESRTLPDALEALAHGWSDERELSVGFETTGTAAPMHAELEATLYRVAQEALTNIAKHAEASKVGITLSYMDDLVVLDVLDDGVGFDPVAAAAAAGRSGGHGLGLVAMRRRLRRVAGTLDIESARGEGTAISAAVPAIPLEAGE